MIGALSATAVSAQTASVGAPPDSAVMDSAKQNEVSAYSIRSGKLALSSVANPGPVNIPDGTYANEAGLILVIVGGRFTRMQEPTGGITEIASIRLSRQRLVRMLPSTNALNAVSELPLPSGTFKSEDGKSFFTIVFGRPTAFTVASVPGEGEQK